MTTLTVTPAQEQALEYLTVPEQGLAYAGTLLATTVTPPTRFFSAPGEVVVVVVVVVREVAVVVINAVVDVVWVDVLVIVL